jgi:signal transduction histidine kinase
MIQAAFQNRPGRVIALGRLLLAAIFLAAIWIDPGQLSRQQPGEVQALFAAYLGWAALVLALTWKSWWLDYKLADFAHLVDIAAFAVMVFFTESYTSPFYTFFVFLVLSAALRWNWRETAMTAAAVTLFFLTAGLAALAIGNGEINLQPLLVRFSYLAVLALIFIWFLVHGRPAPPAWEPASELDGPPIRPAMRRAAATLRARRIVIAWSQDEEPWVNIAADNGVEGEAGETRLGPEEYRGFAPEATGGLPFLFDVRRGRGLARDPDDPRRLRALRDAFDTDFAERFEVRRGLAIPFRAREYHGELFALDIEGLCPEDLRAAETLAGEIAALFDRASMAAVSEQAAVARARMALARDLHDSVVQVLAGASFRLEGLKGWIASGGDAAAEIDAVKAELKEEQRNVRAFITGLRSGRGWVRTTDLASGLPIVAEQLRSRWSLECDLAGAAERVEGPLWIEHELHQIVHEAAANAVRHGGATRISITLRREGNDLALGIADNGAGLPEDMEHAAPHATPWSVRERVMGLGGTLSMTAGRGGTRLDIRLPVGSGA